MGGVFYLLRTVPDKFPSGTESHYKMEARGVEPLSEGNVT